jgi:energy-coupling factor transporter transmembrane protein EcfT
MSGLEWFFTFVLIVLYVAFVFTVALVTFRKGYVALGVIGIFFPILWLIGAILPAKPGSAYEIAQSAHYPV